MLRVRGSRRSGRCEGWCNRAALPLGVPEKSQPDGLFLARNNRMNFGSGKPSGSGHRPGSRATGGARVARGGARRGPSSDRGRCGSRS
ncbi:hypothetical protein BSLA_02r3257 [Burkholderia stabilis]|nr:hypothetical protein BSLA_02r3257 [Burkholderia stabilis]